jgi:hypothetical protein
MLKTLLRIYEKNPTIKVKKIKSFFNCPSCLKSLRFLFLGHNS